MDDIQVVMEDKEKSIQDEISGMSESDLRDLMTEEPSGKQETGYISEGDDKERDDWGDVVEDSRSEEEIAEEDKKLKAQSLRQAGDLGSFGLFLLIAVIFSYFIGNWMDGVFNTKPVFTIFWICCGIAASVREMVRNIKKAQKMGEK